MNYGIDIWFADSIHSCFSCVTHSLPLLSILWCASVCTYPDFISFRFVSFHFQFDLKITEVIFSFNFCWYTLYTILAWILRHKILIYRLPSINYYIVHSITYTHTHLYLFAKKKLKIKIYHTKNGKAFCWNAWQIYLVWKCCSSGYFV